MEKDQRSEGLTAGGIISDAKDGDPIGPLNMKHIPIL